MKALAKIVFKMAGSIVLAFGCASAIAATDDLPCFAPEITYAHEHMYNEYVCEGVRHIERNDYEKAVRSFESASAESIFEFPTYRVFPRLAWLYFKIGNMEKAEENLAMAELTISVMVGILRCKQLENYDYLIYKGDRPLNHIYADRVMRVMCGEGYDYIYEQTTLKHVLSDGKQIKRFLEIKEEIMGPQ